MKEKILVYEFGNLRHPELDGLLKQNPLAILPMGQIEEHGPHLPLNTDCVIATEVSRGCAGRLGERIPVILMDVISYGYSGKIMTRWPGTMQVGIDTVRNYLYEVCLSLTGMGFKKIAIVNSHGHHVAICELAARMLADSAGTAPAVVMPLSIASGQLSSILKGGAAASCHAGELETSLILYFKPDLVDTGTVRRNLVVDRGIPPKGAFWSTWVRQPTESGHYGDPCIATAETGRKAYNAIVESTVEFLDVYYTGN